MKIENLKKGMIIKNYRELCKVLEIPISDGNTKKSQLKDLERFISYSKKGNSFIVKDIYRAAKPIINDNGKYSKFIKLLMLDEIYKYLETNTNDTLILSPTSLFKKLEMVNQNYVEGKKNMDKMAKIFNVGVDFIQQFYLDHDTKLKNYIETALNSMQKEKLIFWTKVQMVCIEEVKIALNELETPIIEDGKIKYDSTTTYREATDEEIKVILKIENDVLKNIFNCTNVGQLFLSNRYSNYREEVNRRLKVKYNISYYYNCYKILTDADTFLNRLKRTEKTKIFNDLNCALLENLIDLVKNKEERLIERIDCISEEEFEISSHEIQDTITREIDILKNTIPRKARRIKALNKSK